MPSKKLFRFNLLRSPKGRKERHDVALPPSTTRPTNYRQTTNDATPPPAADKFKKSSGLFNKNKGPGGLEVQTATASSTSGPQDEVSVITPVTGLPPDSPDRVRNLPSLLPPVVASQYPPSRPNYNALYPGTSSYSPQSSPSRGDMRIHVPQGGSGSDHAEDDISVMTPVTGVPMSPEKKAENDRRRFMPPQILEEDDDESRELTVFEADDGGDDGSSGVNKNLNFMLSPRSSGSSPLFPTVFPKPQTKIGSISSKLLKSKKSWLTQTEYFQKAIDSAFAVIDADDSGDVTLEELYAGLLLIHLKMAIYVGAPACRPASKEYVTEIFHLLDTDNSGTLSKEEFTTVMKILYSQMFTRIIIHWMLTLMIVPLISQYIVKYTSLLYWIAHEFWKDIDDDLDPIQRQLWKLWSFFLYCTPQFMDRIGELAWMAFSKVPQGVWKSMPFTILTLAQTSIALPFALNKVEDFFRRVAHSDVGKYGHKLKEI